MAEDFVNKLYFGDNLKWLQDHNAFPDEFVDLIYLDPPFNSNADYNMLFKEATGEKSQAQFHAFTDTWEWNADVQDFYDKFVDQCQSADVAKLLTAFKAIFGTSSMMAYLVMMVPRLMELHRILKSTGSLYLHCDSTASPYLRTSLDVIFGAKNFLNEIVWPRVTSAKGQTRGFGRTHDTILFYVKSPKAYFNRMQRPLSAKRIQQHYANVDPATGRHYMLSDFTQSGPGPARKFGDREIPPPANKHWIWSQERIDEAMREGRLVFTNPNVPRLKRYLDETKGDLIEDVWSDIIPINSQAKEYQGYQTQKPLALLERIIEASCPPDCVVCDPFCGCGTTVHAAQMMKRHWVGIDISYLAIGVVKRRMQQAFPEGLVFQEHGQPKDVAGAEHLAEIGRFHFEQWALSLIKAVPKNKIGHSRADRGVDGWLFYYQGKDDRASILAQVKSGGVQRSDVATLIGDMHNQGAVAGVLITLKPPSRQMLREVADAGKYKVPIWTNMEFPRIQILTIAGLLSGTEKLNAPPQGNPFSNMPPEGDARTQMLLAAERTEPWPKP